MKNNNVILLNKLISDTKEDIITWVKSDDGHKYNYTKWKGDKNITPNKHIVFIMDCYSYENAEIKVYLVNDIKKTREIIYEVKPGFFSFKTINLLEKLLDLIQEKSKFKPKTEMGPPKPKDNKDELGEDDIRYHFKNLM